MGYIIYVNNLYSVIQGIVKEAADNLTDSLKDVAGLKDDYSQSLGASASNIAGLAAFPFLASASALPVIKGSFDPKNLDSVDRDLIGKLRKSWEDMGGSFTNKFTAARHLGITSLDDPKKKRLIAALGNPKSMADANASAMSLLSRFGPNYSPASHSIYTPPDDLFSIGAPVGSYTKPGVLAHEIGHGMSLQGKTDSLRAKLQNVSRIGGRIGSGVGALTAVASPWLDDSTLGTVALGNMAISSPALLEEVRASHNGYKLLRKLGAGRGKALMAFSGVPSYLVTASLPAMPWAIRKIDRAVQS